MSGGRGGFVTLANALTSLSLVAGVLALVSVANSHLMKATALIVFAVVCDSLDGAVARRRGGDGAFGANLDCLADLLSFGIVPAMALYWGPMSVHPVLGVVVCIGFVLTGAWRLARFPLVKRPDVFVGLPLPAAGVPLMIMLLFSPGLAVTAVVTVAVSILMVSTIPFPTVATVVGTFARAVRRFRPAGP